MVCSLPFQNGHEPPLLIATAAVRRIFRYEMKGSACFFVSSWSTHATKAMFEPHGQNFYFSTLRIILGFGFGSCPNSPLKIMF